MSTETQTVLTGAERHKRETSEGWLDRWTGGQGWMEPVADFVQGVVGGFFGLLGGPGRALKSTLHGTWPLGHPLHPALTDVPLGAWTVAVAADYIALATNVVPPVASDLALLVGLLGALASAAAGYTDFHETYGQERRAGLLHGLVMTVSSLVMLASYLIRVFDAGGRPGAIALSTAGYVVALFGAYVGGHLTFKFGTMVNRHAFAAPADEWVAVGAPADFEEGELKLVDASGTPVLVVRRGGVLNAIANTCSHAGGPLNEGSLDGDIVTCPWHGSRFCVTDGSVRGGPATFVQPAYLVHEDGAEVRVKPAYAAH